MTRSSDIPTEIAGSDVVLRLQRTNSEITEEFYVKDAHGKEHLVLVSPTRPGIELKTTANSHVSALQVAQTGLYSGPPTLGFTDASEQKGKDGTIVKLSRNDATGNFVKSILIPTKGKEIRMDLEVDLSQKNPFVNALLMSYAFLPDDMSLSKGGKPDDTFLPGIRPADDDVVGDHVFRAPVAVAQKGSVAALMFPDLDTLKDNRPMETILDLDCKNGVVDAPLISYGFAAYRVRPHVYYSTDFAHPRPIKQPLRLGMTLLLDADAAPNAAYEEANNYSWKRYGRKYFDDVLPQALPFEEYAKYCYPAAFNESIGDNKIGWFEQTIDGHVCGGIPAGWGYGRGWVSWQAWFNNLRSAYGMRVWGKRLGNQDWIDKSDKMLNLALAAPMDHGAVPTTYASRKPAWVGSLMQPENPVGPAFYDLTNMAWKGIWMVRWATDFSDCPRRDEVLSQCRAMADCMMRFQNSDGSIPSWLTQDFKVVPVLDHSAQTALPAWFMFRLSQVKEGAPDGYNAGLQASAIKAANFLRDNVVDGQYYYDFETFFSCSSKDCYQINGQMNHEKMRDPHTLQPPQNTLSMQWTAEALREAFHATHDQKYMDKALMALEKMNLYQEVWPISYRKTAYVFGGFGVQNSDGEYNDARQAQFGETLCDFGAELGRQDLFERGVAAVRASMALINHPLHAQFGIYPNPNEAPGLEPENCCHDGTDIQAGRTGFDWGEGSGLASMGILLDKYGDAYVDRAHDWKVGINGTLPFGEGFARRLLWDVQNNVSDAPKISIGDDTGKKVELTSTFYPSAKVSVDVRNLQLVVDAFGVNASDIKGMLIDGTGKEIPLSGQANGRRLTIPIDSSLQNKVLTLTGFAKGVEVGAPAVSTYIDPVFDFSSPAIRADWKVDGDFALPFAPASRSDFGLPATEIMIGTCEARDGYSDDFTGKIVSPPFVVTKQRIDLLVGGGGGQGAYVELIDAVSGEQLAVARGTNREALSPVSWDVSKLSGRLLQIRVVDSETGGWGHINVGRIRCE